MVDTASADDSAPAAKATRRLAVNASAGFMRSFVWSLLRRGDRAATSIHSLVAGIPGEHWLVLEHATPALSSITERKFGRYWRLVKPLGAFVSLELLRAVRRRAQRATSDAVGTRRWRTVRATRAEKSRDLPGDGFVPEPIGVLTHAITIRSPRRNVWPWLAQMGAGSRAGWYSYDLLDNGRQPSAERIIPELQRLLVGMIFPALPGATDGFTLLAFERERFLVLAWAPRDRPLLMTWAFVLENAERDDATRLVVRARAASGYRFYGLPLWLTEPVVRLVHFVMQRKQLLGIARRAERSAHEGVVTNPRAA